MSDTTPTSAHEVVADHDAVYTASSRTNQPRFTVNCEVGWGDEIAELLEDAGFTVDTKERCEATVEDHGEFIQLRGSHPNR